ncbi:MAG: PAS domain S-box protein [Planctomycetes bacterium]|nr:PAS domain S-box protein [Planctomycetota bacterium]
MPSHAIPGAPGIQTAGVTEPAQAALQAMLAQTSFSTGEDFFRSLTRSLSQVMGVRHALVGEVCLPRRESVRSLAFFTDGAFRGPVEYALAGGPCELTALLKPQTILRGVQLQFPDCAVLRDLEAESYVGHPLLSSTGEVIGVLFAIHDQPLPTAEPLATVLRAFAARAGPELERRRIEGDLSASQRRYHAIFEQAAVGIAQVGVDGTILEANPTFCRILGYGREELAGKSIREITCREDWPVNASLIARAMAGEYQTYGLEKRYLHKDGSPVWAELHAALVRDAAGRPEYIIGVMQDITERKRLESQLLQSQKLDSLGRLAGGIAHDFNNLLTVLLSYTDLASSAPDALTRSKCLDSIRTAGERAAALTAQLLAFARKDGGALGSVDVRTAVADLERMLRPLLGERIDLQIFVPDGPLGASIDGAKLQQVLMNLAINARDAMGGEGRLTIEVEHLSRGAPARGPILGAARESGQSPLQRMEEAARDPQSWVRITVRDTGVGMSEAVRARVFEPFFTTKEVGRGVGMGLATCYGIVRSCGGHIAAESLPDRGTAMRVWLPWVAAVEGDDSRPSVAVEPGNETVLVVEDEPTVRRVLVEGLESRGYRVLEAASPLEALACLERHRGPLDLCVLDVVMPEMSGPALARKLAELRPQARVLFMSGYSGDNLGEFDAGQLDRLLTKPFSHDELARAVRRTLAKAQ